MPELPEEEEKGGVRGRLSGERDETVVGGWGWAEERTGEMGCLTSGEKGKATDLRHPFI